MNKQVFFDYVRNVPFGGRLTQSQIDGLEKGLYWLDKLEVTDNRHKAYVLSTGFWETGQTMQPVREAHGKTDKQSIDRLEAAWKAGKLGSVKTPYWRDGWFGRGIVQLTWKDNYRKMSPYVGVDLVANPSAMLTPDVSWKATIIGMQKGLFSKGNTLDKYFNENTDDPVGARRIVNGVDKAKVIALLYKNFLDALEAADKAVDKKQEPVVSDDVKPQESPSAITVLTGIGSSGILTGLAGISNIYAAVAFMVLMGLLGVMAWAYFSGRITLNRMK